MVEPRTVQPAVVQTKMKVMAAIRFNIRMSIREVLCDVKYFLHSYCGHFFGGPVAQVAQAGEQAKEELYQQILIARCGIERGKPTFNGLCGKPQADRCSRMFSHPYLHC